MHPYIVTNYLNDVLPAPASARRRLSELTVQPRVDEDRLERPWEFVRVMRHIMTVSTSRALRRCSYRRCRAAGTDLTPRTLRWKFPCPRVPTPFTAPCRQIIRSQMPSETCVNHQLRCRHQGAATGFSLADWLQAALFAPRNIESTEYVLHHVPFDFQLPKENQARSC